MLIQGLASILREVKELKTEADAIRAKWGRLAYGGNQGLRLRTIDDTIHGLKQEALTLMGF